MTRVDKIFNTISLIAQNSNLHFRHGSIITKGSSKPLYTGYNTSRSKFSNYMSHSLHSEIDVALKLCLQLKRKNKSKKNIKRILNKYIVWIGRVSRTNTILDSKPCIICKKRLLQMGFNKIGYSDNSNNIIISKLKNIDNCVYTSSDDNV